MSLMDIRLVEGERQHGCDQRDGGAGDLPSSKLRMTVPRLSPVMAR